MASPCARGPVTSPSSPSGSGPVFRSQPSARVPRPARLGGGRDSAASGRITRTLSVWPAIGQRPARVAWKGARCHPLPCLHTRVAQLADLVGRRRSVCARHREPDLARGGRRRRRRALPGGCCDALAIRCRAARRLRRHADPDRRRPRPLRSTADHHPGHGPHGRRSADDGALPQHRHRDPRSGPSRRGRRHGVPRCPASGRDMVPGAARSAHGAAHRRARAERAARRADPGRGPPPRHDVDDHLRQHRRSRHPLRDPRVRRDPQPPSRGRRRRHRQHRHRCRARRHISRGHRHRNPRGLGAPWHPLGVLVALRDTVRRHSVRPVVGHAFPHRRRRALPR